MSAVSFTLPVVSLIVTLAFGKFPHRQ